MKFIPPLDPKRYALEPLLAATGKTLDWLNADDGEPYAPRNIARHSVLEAAKVVPHHYRQAITTRLELRQWIYDLTAAALDDQRDRGAITAAVTHGPSLLLLGPTGVGKTHEAYGAIRELAVSGVAARWSVACAADLYAQLRPRHGVDPEAVFDHHAGAQVLLIDDLGAGRAPSEFTEEVNFRLINHRYENHLPTLITSNVVPKELFARLGDRVASRLSEMCQRVVITGADRRREAAA